jgi:two-component system CheB/CheR fusion protein
MDLTEITKVERLNQEEGQEITFSEILEEVKLDIRELIHSFDPVISTDFAVKGIYYSRKNMRSIIYNLLSNALKYSAPDRKPEVRITTELKNDCITLSLADNGLGLSERDKSKVFGMFKRAHQHIEGTGVGLYMIKKMIENANGTIEVESEKGVGSTFMVNFNC